MAKTLKTRVMQKHDTEANWKLATNFTPLNGEIIIYDEDDNYNYKRVKIGDGTTNVNDLPFIDKKLTDDIAEIEDLANGAVNVASESLNQAKAYTDKKVVQSDWNINDETNSAYIKNRPFYTGNLTKQTLVSGTFYIESDEQ